MSLPSARIVAITAQRTFSANEVEHAWLFLAGITVAVRNGAKSAPAAMAGRLERKSEELALDVADVEQLVQRGEDVARADFPKRVLVYLACDNEPAMADAMGVPLRYVVAGRQRMLSLAGALASGVLGAEVAGPSTR